MRIDWFTSSYSQGASNCLQARWQESSYSVGSGACLSARWAKSSHSLPTNGGCVEARQDGEVQVRDSMHTDEQGRNISPVLAFSAAEWEDALAAIKAGRLPGGR